MGKADVRLRKNITMPKKISSDNGDAYDEMIQLTEPLLSSDETEGDFNQNATLVGCESEFSSCQFAIQLGFPFTVAGLGMVVAGFVLNQAAKSPAFEAIASLTILTTPLLGLKGNLEMTLASRMSTAANVGVLDNPHKRWRVIVGNLMVTQCQACVVGFLAVIFAILKSAIGSNSLNMCELIIVAASSVSTAASASLSLGVLMVTVILLSHHLGVDPDNVATPIAASLGDLTTLLILSFVSNHLFAFHEAYAHHGLWLSVLISCAFLALIPVWLLLSHRNEHVRETVVHGWAPVISAMIISGIGGMVLSAGLERYGVLGYYSPLMNGVGGNLVAVQASRISTSLHRNKSVSLSRDVPLDDRPYFCSPFATFFGSSDVSRSARVLLIFLVPGHLVFLGALYAVDRLVAGGHLDRPTPLFVVIFVLCAFVQVVCLLSVARWIVLRIWISGDDPDNGAIPYLTALGDLLGQMLLLLGFLFLSAVKDPIGVAKAGAASQGVVPTGLPCIISFF